MAIERLMSVEARLKISKLSSDEVPATPPSPWHSTFPGEIARPQANLENPLVYLGLELFGRLGVIARAVDKPQDFANTRTALEELKTGYEAIAPDERTEYLHFLGSQATSEIARMQDAVYDFSDSSALDGLFDEFKAFTGFVIGTAGRQLSLEDLPDTGS